MLPACPFSMIHGQITSFRTLPSQKTANQPATPPPPRLSDRFQTRGSKKKVQHRFNIMDRPQKWNHTRAPLWIHFLTGSAPTDESVCIYHRGAESFRCTQPPPHKPSQPYATLRHWFFYSLVEEFQGKC